LSDSELSTSVKPTILMVDDEENILNQLRCSMEQEFEILTASNEEDAIRLFEREHPPVVTLDLSLNRLDPDDLGGLRLLERFLADEPATRAIIISGNRNNANAIRAVHLGACDFYSKPLRLDEIRVIIQRALHIYQLQQKVQEKHAGGVEGFDRSERSRLKFSDLGFAPATASPTVNLKSAKQAIEIDFVKRALARNRGVVSRAARELGISRVNLYELIDKHQIQVKEFKREETGRVWELDQGR